MHCVREEFAGDRKEQVWDHVEAMAKDLGIPVQRLPEIALRFCVSQPAVPTVIAGMRSQANVDANAAAIDLGPLSVEELQVLAHHRWGRNFYGA